MPSIESIGLPLVFRVREGKGDTEPAGRDAENIVVRTSVRALEGMQKEAIVQYGPSGATWRMVSDEGPYLNGTDLAPFPLAFYTAGMAFSFLNQILQHAHEVGVTLDAIEVSQDNYYTMEGSALRGDMTGGARPVELRVKIDSDAPADAIAGIVHRAEATSPAQAYMRDMLENTFALSHNGRQLTVERVCPSEAPLADDPATSFESLQPEGEKTYAPEIIRKLKAAETLFGVEGGAGSSLQSEQKRTLHVRGIATLRDDGMKEVVVQLFKPIGSSFRFLSDDPVDEGGQERAPAPLAYLSAGVGFCFMTQLGRYAHITKQDLQSYRIVQETMFMRGNRADEHAMALAAPVDTHLFITCDGSDQEARRLLSMGEQTCFLHSAMRTSNPSNIQIEISGEPQSVERG